MIFIIVLIILALDQLTKSLANQSLQLGHPVPLIKGAFYLTLVHNTGAAFGILKNQTPLFTSMFALVLIYSEFKKNSHKKFYTLALSLILAGALGNLIDRLFFGYVIDFLDFRIWPVFNVADSAVTIGTIMLGWSILRSEDKHGTQRHKDTRTPGHKDTRSQGHKDTRVTW